MGVAAPDRSEERLGFARNIAGVFERTLSRASCSRDELEEKVTKER